ncbi:MAG TPA: tRNA (adenosine(37)-N6)-dimethylallyltransferase MiaA [Balneolales bacterium]|nr:tRNA (adenosine(37)-N6)-dimethylallyltransferase MiaA [Balneolales bacterium]
MPKRVIIAGPTAVGKTELSLRIAQYWDVPVVSADARQCYKYMDIGTGKITRDERAGITHYNISILEPDVDDNVQLFLGRVEKWEKELGSDYPFLLFVGGSTLYLEGLIRPLDDVPESDTGILLKLQEELNDKGIDHLYHQLEKVDPFYAGKMDGQNTQRILRALAVYRKTGKPFSSFHEQDEHPEPNEDTLVFVLNRPREHLYKRIEQRVDQMIEQGLVDEVKYLLRKGYDFRGSALKTVGYTELYNYLYGKYDLQEAIRLIKRNTRRYAKRQLTWFKRWQNVIWIDLDELSEEEITDLMIQQINKVVADQKIH